MLAEASLFTCEPSLPQNTASQWGFEPTCKREETTSGHDNVPAWRNLQRAR